MTKRTQLVITILLITGALAWMGRSFIRQLFPPKMDFAHTALTTLTGETTSSIADYKEKVLIVSCFQSWCIDCARETPRLNELAGKILTDQFRVIYISDESIEKIAAFQNRFPSEHILFTKTSQSLSSLGISVFPTTFLINKKGDVVKTSFEGHNWLQEEDAIRKLLAE